MMMDIDRRTCERTADAFRFALDANDFAAVRALLSDGCIYAIRDETHAGPDAIIESYRAANESAHATFDRVVYGSSVHGVGDGEATIEFIDDLVMHSREHRHLCRQRIEIDGDGLITRIEHIDLPGERERLKDFLNAAGPG